MSYQISGAVFGMSMLLGAAMQAATPVAVSYLQQVPIKQFGQKYPTLQVPADPTSSPAGAGLYSHFNLPGYGQWVDVSFSGTVPSLTWGHMKNAELKKFTSAKNGVTYEWGTDTSYFHLINTTGAPTQYTVTFYFDGINPPNSADVFLLVTNLAHGSTATIVQGATTSAPGTNLGDYTFPASQLICGWSCPQGTAQTTFDPATLNFGNGYVVGQTDPANTGWDLYQPPVSSNLRVLSLNVTQAANDNLGFSLGYRACPSLVGNAVQFGPAFVGPNRLYDINPLTGAATNPRQTGNVLTSAFSPMAANGSLYGLSKSGNELFTVDGITGTTNSVAPVIPSFWGGGVAADPTSGLMYGIDATGTLYTISASGVTQAVGPVPYLTTGGTPAAMAFDGAGNLYLVDLNSYYLLKVSAPVSASSAGSAAKIGVVKFPNGKYPTSIAGLAVDPWSGTAYFADNGLYTMNLGTGMLTWVGALSGTPMGLVNELTFMVGAGACPAASTVSF